MIAPNSIVKGIESSPILWLYRVTAFEGDRLPGWRPYLDVGGCTIGEPSCWYFVERSSSSHVSESRIRKKGKSTSSSWDAFFLAVAECRLCTNRLSAFNASW